MCCGWRWALFPELPNTKQRRANVPLHTASQHERQSMWEDRSGGGQRNEKSKRFFVRSLGNRKRIENKSQRRFIRGRRGRALLAPTGWAGGDGNDTSLDAQLRRTNSHSRESTAADDCCRLLRARGTCHRPCSAGLLQHTSNLHLCVVLSNNGSAEANMILALLI